MIEPQANDRQGTPSSDNAEVDTVIALGRLVYRFCRRTPDLLACDAETLWGVIFDSYDGDGDGKRLLASCEGTLAWEKAVLTARLMREVYVAGGLDEEPA